MRLRTFAVMGVALIALTACDSGGAGDQASPSPSANGGNAALLEAAKCMRANGFPNYPDPVQNRDGIWQFPESAGDQAPPPACEALFRNAKQGAPDQRRDKISADEMAKLRQFAQCMRDKGLPDWPDPDNEGSFLLPTRLRPPNVDPTMQTAEEACNQFAPNGIRVNAGTKGTGTGS